MRLGEMELEAAAKAAAGNWRKFECFCLASDSPRTPRTGPSSTRTTGTAGLLDQSNAAAIEEAMKPFTRGGRRGFRAAITTGPWCDRWASASGLSRTARSPKAFRKYHELGPAHGRLPGPRRRGLFPPGIRGDPGEPARRRLETEKRVRPPGRAGRATCTTGCRTTILAAVENSDDQGGYPSEDQLRVAFEALGYQRPTRVNARVVGGRGKEPRPLTPSNPSSIQDL